MSYKKIVFFNKNVSVVCLEFFGVWVDLLELGFYDLLICCSCVFVRIIFDFVCYFL